MRVLTATEATQGDRKGDYCWTVPGELVRVPTETCVDRLCGCDRAFAGLASSRATTTCVVSELDASPEDLWPVFTESLARQGWVDPEAPDRAVIGEVLADNLRIAELFDPGTILERRGDQVRVRRLTEA